MKQTILFLQGGGEGAYEADAQLVASLRRTLGDTYAIQYPKMPNEDDPDYERWKPVIEKEAEKLGSNAIVIAHSLGGSFLLKFLVEEKPRNKIAGIFLIATPYWGGDGWRYQGYERVALPNGFARRMPHGASIFIYHGRNDEIVPYAHLALYAERLPQAHTRSLEGGHQLNNDLAEVAADIRSLRAAT